MRNHVTNSVKKPKQTYNKKLIDNHKNDTKAFSRTMKKIIPGEKSSAGFKISILMASFAVMERKLLMVSINFRFSRCTP